MAKKKVVLIPFWIQEMLNRKGLPLATCLELPKIRTMLTLEDLAAFAALQMMSAEVTGKDHALGSELYSEWQASIAAGDAESQSALNIADTAIDQESVRQRLFDAEGKLERYEKPFITYDLTPAVCGVVIFPGYFVPGAHSELYLSLIESILKVLYVYDTYSEVAKTSLFTRYLELLSLRLS